MIKTLPDEELFGSIIHFARKHRCDVQLKQNNQFHLTCKAQHIKSEQVMGWIRTLTPLVPLVTLLIDRLPQKK